MIERHTVYGRSSEDGGRFKDGLKSYNELQSRVLRCLGKACAAIASSGHSDDGHHAIKVNLEALVQAIMRNPVAALTPQVGHQHPSLHHSTAFACYHPFCLQASIWLACT